MVPEGLGTALKPATEHWILARKPLDGTVADTVLRHGTGALNVDKCRVAGLVDAGRNKTKGQGPKFNGNTFNGGREYAESISSFEQHPTGRWPSNVVLTHHPDCNGSCVPGCPVAEMDRQSGERPSGSRAAGVRKGGTNWSGPWSGDGGPAIEGSSGGASRFFPTFVWEADDFAPFLYCAKASRSDRGVGNTHNTVKPIALMRWLARLVTPEGGTVLDPFLGSGTTGLAAFREGFRFIGAENDPDSFEIARRRLAGATAGGRQATFFEA